MEKDLNSYIKKSHLKAVEAFNEELKAFAEETGENPVTLYEDPYTSFTLAHVYVSHGYLFYNYCGTLECELVVDTDPDTQEPFEVELDGIMDYIKFWRKCLKRAKKFWEMDTDKLDAIQNGEAEYHEDEEED